MQSGLVGRTEFIVERVAQEDVRESKGGWLLRDGRNEPAIDRRL
jgi:hypothetical protein